MTLAVFDGLLVLIFALMLFGLFWFLFRQHKTKSKTEFSVDRAFAEHAPQSQKSTTANTWRNTFIAPPPTTPNVTTTTTQTIITETNKNNTQSAPLKKPSVTFNPQLSTQISQNSIASLSQQKKYTPTASRTVSQIDSEMSVPDSSAKIKDHIISPIGSKTIETNAKKAKNKSSKGPLAFVKNMFHKKDNEKGVASKPMGCRSKSDFVQEASTHNHSAHVDTDTYLHPDQRVRIDSTSSLESKSSGFENNSELSLTSTRSSNRASTDLQSI